MSLHKHPCCRAFVELFTDSKLVRGLKSLMQARAFGQPKLTSAENWRHWAARECSWSTGGDGHLCSTAMLIDYLHHRAENRRHEGWSDDIAFPAPDNNSTPQETR